MLLHRFFDRFLLGMMREAVEAVVKRREALFACTKRVSGHNRKTELKPHLSKHPQHFFVADVCHAG